MIQVCSRCGTRWNVRDRQRVWCPRCQGTLLAPSAAPGSPHQAEPGLAGRSAPAHAGSPQGGSAPSGFRWIAVRPGPPPPPRAGRRPLGPTPRYQTVPRWGLADPVAPPPDTGSAPAGKGATPTGARAALVAAGVILAAAAVVHIVRYLLLLINRTTLLPPVIAGGSLVAGLVVSLAAIVAVIAAAVALTSWLIGRRAAAFAVHGQADPRPAWALWAGCLTPVANLVWAPVFVSELAHAERCHARQRRAVALWWVVWAISFLVCGWAIWTSRADDAQGIADNTLTMVAAYLSGLAAVVLLWRVFDGFFSKPVDRPRHRWVVVGQPAPAAPAAANPEPAGPTEATTDAREPAAASAVEPEDREPAA